MICERCNKKKATVFYRENIGGRVRAMRLCSDCAEILERAGELEDLSTAISGFVSPFFQSDETFYAIPIPSVHKDGQATSPRKCRECGATFGEITASGKMGCATCYATFDEELSHALTGLHGNAGHRGKVSAGYRVKREKAERLTVLKKQLRDAVAAEKYEAAVELRDAIRALEAEL